MSMRMTTAAHFVSLAKEERVLTHFVGALAAYQVSGSRRHGTALVLYVIHDDSVEIFEPTKASNQDHVVGLAYALMSENRLENLHFWFRPSLSQDVLRQTVPRFLHHATSGVEPYMIKLSSIDSAYFPLVLESVQRVVWTDDDRYGLYVLDADVPVKDIPVGATWQVDGETFVMDVATSDDAPVLLSQTDIGYYPQYILELINDPVMSKLIRVVRRTATMQAVSWALVHSDFSIGLLSTLPEYRRKGLVQRALASTAVAFREVIAAHDGLLGLKPHCFVNTENLPSQRLVDSLGFKIVPDKTFHWLGVVV
ncbi:hypothetical protein AC1031_012993 [Aphanomyces cochlioides]|nr:hypothetical protein AC1031_012993 [Aphanomyces cochlioides]